MLPLTGQGSGLEQLGWAPALRPNESTLFEVDARAGFDKPARITNTTIKRGIEGLQQERASEVLPVSAQARLI